MITTLIQFVRVLGADLESRADRWSQDAGQASLHGDGQRESRCLAVSSILREIAAAVQYAAKQTMFL
jgi:hypothetical protein